MCACVCNDYIRASSTGGIKTSVSLLSSLSTISTTKNTITIKITNMKKFYISSIVVLGSSLAAFGQTEVTPVADPSALLTSTQNVANTALLAGLGLSVAVIGWRLIKRFIRA